MGATPHGCGEYFPLDPSLEKLDGAPSDGERDLTERRVEVFAFDGKLGVQPPVPGEISKRGSPEYTEWRARGRLVHDTAAPARRTLRLRLHDSDARPMTTARYQIRLGPVTWLEGTTASGWVELTVAAAGCGLPVAVRWSSLAWTADPDTDEEYEYTAEVRLDCGAGAGSEQTQTAARLHNLGYPSGDDDGLQAAVRRFQRDFGLPEEAITDGLLPPESRDRLWRIFDTDCDATRCPRPPSSPPAEEAPVPASGPMSLSCPVFDASAGSGGPHCDGSLARSPALSWTSSPKEARSHALVLADRDPLGTTTFRWLVYDIPVGVDRLAAAADVKLAGASCAVNSLGETGYCAPDRDAVEVILCLYSLDARLEKRGVAVGMLQEFIGRHLLATSYCVGSRGMRTIDRT